MFIIIYVGAIAVLFLFVVMMLNVKLQEYISFTKIAFILIIMLLIFFQSFLILNTLFYGEINLVSSLNFDTLYNINKFGQTIV